MGEARRLLLALVLLLLATPALAAPCGGDFNAFLAALARDAQGQGVSRAIIDQAFAGLTPDPAVLAFDRRQRARYCPTIRSPAGKQTCPVDRTEQ